MPGRPAFAALAIAAVALPAPAWANAYAFPLDIRAKPLAAALQDLARQTGIELMYDRALVRGMRAPAVKGRMTVDAALARLLDGSDLVARRASSGAWLIARRPAVAEAVAAEAVEGPELLVSGRLTQNVDIRRRENDVQPYRIDTGQQIVRAHRDDLDQYFRSRVTPNTQVVPPSLGTAGRTYSQIDLRGLGQEQTLVLIDGRRMPSIPEGNFGFIQPDLNAVPLHAIERVETLTGTAGGIHGFGALGGVVNVVLRRDYRAVELHGTTGISSRGDAGRLALEARIGFTPDGGRTDVMVYLSHARAQPLREGQRDYALRARRIAYGLVPDLYALSPPLAKSIEVSNLFGFSDGLTFKLEYGGASIGADSTYLPTGFAGSPADLVAQLTERAGQVDLMPPDGATASDLASTATTSALIASVRHGLGGDAEIYLDALVLDNRGRSTNRSDYGSLLLYPEDPRNPFDNYVSLRFPTTGKINPVRADVRSERVTAGGILPLLAGWKATAEASFGATHIDVSSSAENVQSFVDDGDLAVNPFGNWEAFQQALLPYTFDTASAWRARNRFREQSVRIAGTPFRTSAGAATLTLMLQGRQEKVPSFTRSITASIFDPPTSVSTIAERSTSTRSAYAELRAPLTGDAASFPLLRGLEVQVAARYDRQKLEFYEDPVDPDPAEPLRPRFAGATYTVGAKLQPVPWLLLRGSYATGRQPPEASSLISLEYPGSLILVADPKRDNAIFSDFGSYRLLLQGSPDVEAVRASTLALGFVINPLGDDGPRFSLDYSHVRRRHDYYRLTEQIVLAHEDEWPERVTREPLTAEDQAKGFTGGRITQIDARGTNGARLDVQSLDARLDWTMPFARGTLRAYGAATLQFRNRFAAPFEPFEERVGLRNGPLKWRANGGADWTLGPTTVGANLQFFNRYRIDGVEGPGNPETQGSLYVRAQAYLDLFASRRFPIEWAGAGRTIGVDIGIVNVFDHAPPYQSLSISGGPEYSFFGDPRRRRFELTLSAAF